MTYMLCSLNEVLIFVVGDPAISNMVTTPLPVNILSHDLPVLDILIPMLGIVREVSLASLTFFKGAY